MKHGSLRWQTIVAHYECDDDDYIIFTVSHLLFHVGCIVLIVSYCLCT